MTLRRPDILFRCPYCGKPITDARRLPYPATMLAHLAPVYRCRCGKHMGAPIKTDKDKP